MAIPQYASLHHWYSAPRQLSALSTRIDDFSGYGRHGTRIGTLISIVAGWFNLGEQSGGGNNGIQPPTLSTNGWGSYSYVARVRRSTASNWADYFQIVGGLTGGTQGVVTYYDPGATLHQVHNNFGFSGSWAYDIAPWAVDATHVLAVSYDSAATTLRCYVDGVLTSTVTGAAANTGAGNFAWFVWNGGQSWGHESDNLMLWPGVALNSTDIGNATSYFDLARTAFTPADGATGVSVSTTLTITFNTPPTIGTGNLTVVETGVGNFEVVDITDAGQVSVSGNDLIVTLSGNLAGGTAYNILLDAGAIVGDPGIASATTWNFVTAGGAMVGNADLVLTGSATLAGSGALAAASTLTLTQAGALTGAGALASGITLALNASGTLAGDGSLAGDSPLALALSGTMAGAGALSGNADQALALSGTLTATGALVGAAGQVLTLAGTLAGTGALSGDAPLVLDVTGTLSLPPGGMQGDATLELTVSGVLAGSGALSGASSLDLDADGTLTGLGALAGSASMALGLSGTLAAPGLMVGNAALVLAASGTMQGSAVLAGNAGLALTLSGILRGAPQIARIVGSLSTIQPGPHATLSTALPGVRATIGES